MFTGCCAPLARTVPRATWFPPLGKVIRAMGVKEFAAKIGMESPNLLRAINPRHNPTQSTINRLLNPFGFKLSLARIQKPKRSHAA
jgi:DNA-binding phage protein